MEVLVVKVFTLLAIYILVELNIKIHLLNFATNGAPYFLPFLTIIEANVKIDI